MSTKIIILDFDGTLGDTTDVIIRTTQAAIKELGLPSRTDAECAAMIGLRLTEIPPVLFPGIEVDCDLYAQTYRRIFNILNTPGAVVLYPHVLETLQELKSRGIILTIASSRSNASLNEYIANLGLTSTISYVLGGNDVANGKPHPEAVNMTLEKFGFKPEEAIVVGDTSLRQRHPRKPLRRNLDHRRLQRPAGAHLICVYVCEPVCHFCHQI